MGRVATGANQFVGAGMLWFDRFDDAGASTGYRPLGACEPFTVTASQVNKLESRDPTQPSRPILNSVVTSQTLGFKFQCMEITKENLALFGMGTTTSVVQAGATVTDRSIANVKQGVGIDLGAFKLSGFSLKVGATVKTGGDVDYYIDLVRGLLYITPGGGIADNDTILVTYTKAAYTKDMATVATKGKIKGALWFANNPTTGRVWDFRVPLASLTPDADFQMIGDQFATLGISATIEASPAYPNYPNGWYEDYS